MRRYVTNWVFLNNQNTTNGVFVIYNYKSRFVLYSFNPKIGLMHTPQWRKTLTTTVLQFSMVLMCLALVFACKKGDPGPTGATGPAGSNGAAGATGPQGPAGTANVIYSQWFTASPWTKDTVFDVYGFNYTKSTADITQPVLDSGTVIAFGKLAGYNTLIWPTGQVSQMPIVLSYRFSPGGITYTDTWSAL